MKRHYRLGASAFLFVVILALTLGAKSSVAQIVNVSTWHNDIGRTGQNTSETTLTPSNVIPATFGKLCSYSVDGQVYAQPLVQTGLTIGGQQHTVVFVVTQTDKIYAFDGVNVNNGNCVLLIPQVTLLPAGEVPVDCNLLGGCPSGPDFGILSTPVIDPGTGTIYVVTHSDCPPKTNQCNNQDSTPVFYHRLHALSMTNLSEKYSGPVQICQNVCGTQTGTAFSQTHIQRPGLLWLSSSQSGQQNDVVYVAFSMADGATGNPNGWIFAYNASNFQDSNYPLTYHVTDATNNGWRGGIWQGGAGLMVAKDSNGGYYIYFSTGDGDFNLDKQQSPHTDAGDSFIKLSPDLTVPSATYYFTPADQYARGGCAPPDDNDFDFGSGGIIAIPESVFSTPKNFYAVKADKENYLWVMDRTNPGGYTGDDTGTYCGSTQLCNHRCTNANNNVEQLAFSTNHTSNPEARSTPAFWSGTVSSSEVGELYFTVPGNSGGPVAGQMRRYPVSSSCTSGNPPICDYAAQTSVDASGSGLGYAATPSVSSNTGQNGYSGGIVWAIKYDSGETPPVLFAFDAGTLSELYDTKKCNPGGTYPDQPGTATRFSVPTIANGHVYIGTKTDFDIYGVLNTRSCN
jgi:hypothetical protein